MRNIFFISFLVYSLSILAQSDGYLGGPKNDYGNPSAKYGNPGSGIGNPSSPPPMKEGISSQPHQNPYFGGNQGGYGRPWHSRHIEHAPSKGRH
jgi:hypothetical protein